LAVAKAGAQLRKLLPGRSDLQTIRTVRGGREIVVAGLIDLFGSGLYVPVSTVYLLRTIGLPVGVIGITLGIGGGVAVAGPVLAGRLGQRFGPGKALITVYLSLFAAFGLLGAAQDGIMACCALVVGSGLLAGSAPLQQQLVGQSATGETRTAFLAVSRTTGNIALGVGGLASVIALSYPYPWVLRTMIVADASSFAFAAVFLALAARGQGQASAPTAPSQRATPQRATAWHDLRYVGLTAVHSFMSLDYSVMRVAVPLWLVRQHAPVSLTALAFTLSTVVVVVTQVGAGRLAANVPSAGRAIAATGVLFFAGCVLLGIFPFITLPARIACFTLATICVGIGESYAFAAGWTLSYSLAQPGREGDYLGVFGVAAPLQRAAGPILMTLIVLPLGVYGWLLLAAAFIAMSQVERSIAVGFRAVADETPPATEEITLNAAGEG
jgi:MFS family permease